MHARESQAQRNSAHGEGYVLERGVLHVQLPYDMAQDQQGAGGIDLFMGGVGPDGHHKSRALARSIADGDVSFGLALRRRGWESIAARGSQSVCALWARR